MRALSFFGPSPYASVAAALATKSTTHHSVVVHLKISRRNFLTDYEAFIIDDLDIGNTPRSPTQREREELKRQFQDNCTKAAELISGANCFLFATGAGFSADSGLAVYKDIANVPSYRKRQLTYLDICVPSWLSDDKRTFYGFWGACFNDYRDTLPHVGYDIVKSWRDTLFSKSDYWETQFRNANSKLLNLDVSQYKNTVFTPSDMHSPPGPFFVLTSNVDAHSLKSGLNRNEIHQIHGNTETWQCSIPCQQTLWEAPQGHRFEVDRSTMLTPLPINTPKLDENHLFFPTHVKCRNHGCKAFARPAILMFGDYHWVSDAVEEEFYGGWVNTALRLLQESPDYRMVIVEIGCGNNVTTIRMKTENLLSVFPQFSSQLSMIRINPDFPFADYQTNIPRIVPILAKGKEALENINRELQKIIFNTQKKKK